MAPPYLLGIKHTNTNCYVCRPVPKRHRHANTQYMYERSAMLGIAPDCSMCLDPAHPKQTTGRIKLVSTSSTLHHVQFSETYQEELIAAHLDFMDSTFHVDVDQIAGGRLDDFTRSWKKWYWEQPLPVDCAAVVGLNDVAHLSVDQFMKKLQDWRALMEEHSRIHNHAVPNTLAVATLLYPPKFYWHEGNPFDPPTGWRSYNIKMRALTDAIKQFNLEGGVGRMVGFHQEGSRLYKGKRQHRWETWREFHTQGDERDYSDFLHLVDEHRVKMYIKLLKYFFHRTYFNNEAAVVPVREEGEATCEVEVCHVTGGEASEDNDAAGLGNTVTSGSVGTTVTTVVEGGDDTGGDPSEINDEVMEGDTVNIGSGGPVATIAVEVRTSDKEPVTALLELPDFKPDITLLDVPGYADLLDIPDDDV